VSNWNQVVKTSSGQISFRPLGPIGSSLGDLLKQAVSNTATSQATIIGFVDLDNADQMLEALRIKASKR